MTILGGEKYGVQIHRRICNSKQEAFKAFKNGEDVRIGYQHKDDGAYWNFNQFRNEMKGDTRYRKRKV